MEATYCSEDIRQLAKALLAVQHKLAPATRDATNPFTRSTYATLNSVMNSCREALIANGIWLTQIPVPADHGYIGLYTKLTHVETGQFQASLTVLPLQKNDCQGAGSAITYARRYALTAMLGMVTEDDDDGEGAKLAPQFRQEPPKPAPQVRQEQPRSNDLPRLDGVNYRNIRAENGKVYTVAQGNTMPVKDTLHAAGFRWDAAQKYWWRAAQAI